MHGRLSARPEPKYLSVVVEIADDLRRVTLVGA
jgi:hypothetical protein